MLTKKQTQQRIRELKKIINHHRYQYHVLDRSEISDEAYDSLEEELRRLEERFPEFITPDSPTRRVSGLPLTAFRKIKHEIAQWSFDNAFTEEEVRAFDARVKKMSGANPTYVCELKIDGFKIVLTYEKGILKTAATRGDGAMGEDVTANVRMIKSIPLKLRRAASVIVEGEIWMGKKEFTELNRKQQAKNEPTFANPRNVAAGTIRQLDAKIVSERKLNSFIYDLVKADFTLPETQFAELKLLSKLGFKVNKHFIKAKNINEVIKYWRDWQNKKNQEDYRLDGVVLKVNERSIQAGLGYTGKSPRFAVAFKFPAEQVTTVVEGISLQVGRQGAITPVAELRPVSVAGTTVSRATLHNEDEIKRLDVRVGDTVIIQKSGDIIPDVIQVLKNLRPKNAKPFTFPKSLPGVGAIERKTGEAAHRVVDKNTFAQMKKRFHYFVSKPAFDISGLGPKQIDLLFEHNLLSTYADIFKLTEDELLSLPRFADLSAKKLINAINSRRRVSFTRFIIALSIPQVGEETAEDLAGYFGALKKLMEAKREELAEINGVGAVVAEKITDFFADKNNQKIIADLLKEVKILPFDRSRAGKVYGKLKGQTFVLTGAMEQMTRDEAKKKIKDLGGEVTGTVSKNTTYLIAGANPGSKYQKARQLGVTVLSENEFLNLLK